MSRAFTISGDYGSLRKTHGASRRSAVLILNHPLFVLALPLTGFSHQAKQSWSQFFQPCSFSANTIVAPRVPILHLPLHLEYVTTMQLPDQSIFWAGYAEGRFIHLYGRSRFDSHSLTHAVLHKSNFSVISHHDPHLIGEEPCCLTVNGLVFIVDNYWSAVTLIPHPNHRYIHVPLSGKNFVWYDENGELRILWTIMPIQLYKIDYNTGAPTRLHYPHDPGPWNDEYRGGTPLFKVNASFHFGIGHRTHHTGGFLQHDPFLIIKRGNRFEILPIEKPPMAYHVFDPSAFFSFIVHSIS
jgi:hypothetical protein